MAKKRMEPPANKFDAASQAVNVIKEELREFSFSLGDDDRDRQLQLLNMIQKLNDVYYILRQAHRLHGSLTDFLSESQD